MNTVEAIGARRSIRRFTDAPVSEEEIRALLEAATLAPSGMNRQPWRFVVVQGEKRAEMVDLMRSAIAKLKSEGVKTGSIRRTAETMAKAPVTIFIFDDVEMREDMIGSFPDLLGHMVDIQSIGAAIQNMLLAATDRGLGTLWIGHVFHAYEELCAWLGESRLMVAAVSVGYPDEAPGPRPRLSVDEVTRWVG
ncbi:MAG: nitroreductase [Anaerolineae bacterium]|nr:nitroreductase [Anaerolineae bacterium]